MEPIVAALKSGGMTLVGVPASSSKTGAVLEQKIDELSRWIDKQSATSSAPEA
ncbi:MAG: hypothetical protein ACOYIK_09005 [Coriobacteriales bacterium]|jgi:hypothetical protein